MACDQGRVFVNDRIAKAATTLKLADKIHIELGSRALTVEVAELPVKAPPAQDAANLYRMIEEIRRPREQYDPNEEDLWS